MVADIVHTTRFVHCSHWNSMPPVSEPGRGMQTEMLRSYSNLHFRRRKGVAQVLRARSTSTGFYRVFPASHLGVDQSHVALC